MAVRLGELEHLLTTVLEACSSLGDTPPSSTITAGIVPLYLRWLCCESPPREEESESEEGVITISVGGCERPREKISLEVSSASPTLSPSSSPSPSRSSSAPSRSECRNSRVESIELRGNSTGGRQRGGREEKSVGIGRSANGFGTAIGGSTHG